MELFLHDSNSFISELTLSGISKVINNLVLSSKPNSMLKCLVGLSSLIMLNNSFSCFKKIFSAPKPSIFLLPVESIFNLYLESLVLSTSYDVVKVSPALFVFK